MSGVVVDGESLSCRDVVEVAPGGVPVTLSGPALAAATEVHRTALAASAVRPVYGRTTGVGANRDAVVGTGDAETHDLRLLLSHAAGVGDPLDATVVRAAMLVRLNQLVAAGSGIHPRFLRALEFGLAILAVSALSFLGYGAPPPAPEWGSLVADGRNYLAVAWWICAMPGLVIAATVLSVNRVSRALDGEWGRSA